MSIFSKYKGFKLFSNRKRAVLTKRTEQQVAAALKEGVCPNCRSSDSLSKFYALTLSFNNYRLVLLFMLIIGLAGHLLMLTIEQTLPFAAVAVLPLIFRYSKKDFCENCGRDVETGKEVKLP